jgi:hypothetical protein
MKPRGRLVASVLHPLSTANFPLADGEANIGEWTGRYFGAPRRCIDTPWVGFGEVPEEGRKINCHHHTITEYFDALASAGLTLNRLLEAEPPPEFAAKNAARYEEAMSRPLYLMFSAIKQSGGSVCCPASSSFSSSYNKNSVFE